MDEEDGRPGPRARQFGAFDVPRDVLVRSLCRSLPPAEQASLLTPIAIADICPRQSFTAIQPTSNPAPFSGADLPKAPAPPQVEEKLNENVPGK
jgi:hypothetical protein